MSKSQVPTTKARRSSGRTDSPQIADDVRSGSKGTQDPHYNRCLEHTAPGDEHVLVGNLRSSLTDAGALIVGTPSIESSASTAKGIDDLSLTGPTTTFTGSNGRAWPGRPEAE